MEKEINILTIVEGPLFISAYNKLDKKLKEIYPNIHLYSLSKKGIMKSNLINLKT